jgi:hypothetical protein
MPLAYAVVRQFLSTLLVRRFADPFQLQFPIAAARSQLRFQ